MESRANKFILMVDDDPEDILLTKTALEEVAPAITLVSVNDGQEVIDYFAKVNKSLTTPLPELIILDLNMPRKSGFEVLQEMRKNPDLKRIPVVILTTSTMEADINRCYEMGANSFIPKPQTYDQLLAVMNRAVEYWFDVNRLPTAV